VSNRKDGAVTDEQVIHPSADAPHHVGERFAAMWCRVGILQPVGDSLWLLRLDFREGSSCPTAEIAITQQGFHAGVKPKTIRGLRGAQRRASQESVTRWKAAGERGETFAPAAV